MHLDEIVCDKCSICRGVNLVNIRKITGTNEIFFLIGSAIFVWKYTNKKRIF